MQKTLAWFTPLPPQRNGIADYAAILLSEVSKSRRCLVFSEDLPLPLPDGIEVADPAQAYRHLKPETPVLHQIGNNGGHSFVLRALRHHGGVVALHDLSLLYLYELTASRLEEILGHMAEPAGALGQVYARHWKDNAIKTAANYVLFDLAGEILTRARRVIVHSNFARKKLAAIHGDAAAEKIDVIPHFAPPLRYASREEARAITGVEADTLLILTSGFATRAKRFDWLVEALDTLARAGLAFRWIHAGEERADEFDLSTAITARPALAMRAAITGYVSENLLDAYIASSDIVVNLRFPSVGESSGTLARAFSAGRCCIVNDTAAYAEIPRDAAVHIPVFDTVSALTRALDALIRSRELRECFGERASMLARGELSLESVAARYLESVDLAFTPRKTGRGRAGKQAVAPTATPSRMRRSEIRLASMDELRAVAADLSARQGPFEIIIWFDSAEAFAAGTLSNPGLLRQAIAPHVLVDGFHFVASASGSEVGIEISGRSYAFGAAA